MKLVFSIKLKVVRRPVVIVTKCSYELRIVQLQNESKKCSRQGFTCAITDKFPSHFSCLGMWL